MRNLKLAFRTLFKTPFVTVVAILSLALGIGANAAIFSLFDQMLLRPLPVPEPERLVNLGRARAQTRARSRADRPATATRSSATRCSAISSASRRCSPASPRTVPFGANLAVQGRDGRTATACSSRARYFPVLGLTPALGRLFGPPDDATIGGALRGRAELRLLGSRTSAAIPAVLDETMIVNGHTMTIVGVAPRGFERHDARHAPGRLRADHDARHELEPRFNGFEQPAELLGLPLRPAQARRVDRAGAAAI